MRQLDMVPSSPEIVGPGRTDADFSLIREIGRGGMGVVYEALQTSLRGESR